MAKLHELLTVKGDLETTAKKIWTEASVTFSKMERARFFSLISTAQ